MNRPAEKSVVLIHGLWFREAWLRILAGRLEDAGYSVTGFNYRSTRIPLERSARRLQHLCNRRFPNGTHLVGHSLGGLLILNMLLTGHWRAEGKVVFLGTPLAGSAVARRAAHWPGASVMLGTASSPLLRGVKGWPEGRAMGMIAGSRSVGLGRITGGLDRPNDGTVAVSETRHPGLTDHVTLDVTHTGMIYSKPVADQLILFLENSRFSPGKAPA